MVELIPSPDPYTLLPPFLACLPTAFASVQPPPALLGLLSPILRQRVQLLTSTSGSDSWLKLLCWDREKAEDLQRIVEQGTWEPHPVSGEIEVSGVDNIRYKRFDEETLRSQLSLSERDLTVVYLWCTADQGGNGWRVAELVPYNTEYERDSTWSTSISEANSSFSDRILTEALRDAEAADNSRPLAAPAQPSLEEADDDDDYWAQYDQTPARTPAHKRSPLPQSQAPRNGSADDDYYAQYSSVQPAMDASDPSEETHDELNGQTTLNGNTFAHLLRRRNGAQSPSPHQDDENSVSVSQPHPSRPPSSSGGSYFVARLEESAELQSNSEVGVKQHISTSMKSMYRLASSMGMDKEEFKRIVQRELDVLEMLD